jgi:hypothetical protein
MATRIPTAAQNAAANAVGDRADGGAGPGTIDVFTGAQPATANDAETGDLLLTFTLSDPAWSAAVAGVKTLDVTPVPAAVGADDGVAGWARMKDSTGATVIDGAVTATGGGGQFTLSTTTVSVGLDVEITSGTLTMPAG